MKQRSLLDETLVIWGGCAKASARVGATDELGYRVVEDQLTNYDLQAATLHLLGMDHKRLTYRSRVAISA